MSNGNQHKKKGYRKRNNCFKAMHSYGKDLVRLQAERDENFIEGIPLEELWELGKLTE